MAKVGKEIISKEQEDLSALSEANESYEYAMNAEKEKINAQKELWNTIFDRLGEVGIKERIKDWATKSKWEAIGKYSIIFAVALIVGFLCWVGKISGEMAAVIYSAVIGYLLGKNLWGSHFTNPFNFGWVASQPAPISFGMITLFFRIKKRAIFKGIIRYNYT